MVSELAGLGRLQQFDKRNLEHPLPKLASTKQWQYWKIPRALDQGDTPQCVGYGGQHWLLASPTINKPTFTPTQLYKMAQENDEWPGEDYEGSSTLGLMKALKKIGAVSEYKWAFDAETIVNWVLERGPVVVGTDWYEDMFMGIKTKYGYYLEPTGPYAGGHEWLIYGANRARWSPDGSGAIRMLNSWGPGWLEQGHAWMSIQVLDKLIKDGGEAATALEIKI